MTTLPMGFVYPPIPFAPYFGSPEDFVYSVNGESSSKEPQSTKKAELRLRPLVYQPHESHRTTELPMTVSSSDDIWVHVPFANINGLVIPIVQPLHMLNDQVNKTRVTNRRRRSVSSDDGKCQ